MGIPPGLLSHTMAATTQPRTALDVAVSYSTMGATLAGSSASVGNAFMPVGLMGPPMAGLSMRRTRSRSSMPSIGAMAPPGNGGGGWGNGGIGNAGGRSTAWNAAAAAAGLPPAEPMVSSLSEAALAIGLDMGAAADELVGLPMRRTRSRGSVGDSSPRAASSPGRAVRNPDRLSTISTWLPQQVPSADIVAASSSGRVPSSAATLGLPPAPALVPTLSEWGTLGLETQGTAESSSPGGPGILQGSPMRRTRSRGAGSSTNLPALPMVSTKSELDTLIDSFINPDQP